MNEAQEKAARALIRQMRLMTAFMYIWSAIMFVALCGMLAEIFHLWKPH